MRPGASHGSWVLVVPPSSPLSKGDRQSMWPPIFYGGGLPRAVGPDAPPKGAGHGARIDGRGNDLLVGALPSHTSPNVSHPAWNLCGTQCSR